MGDADVPSPSLTMHAHKPYDARLNLAHATTTTTIATSPGLESALLSSACRCAIFHVFFYMQETSLDHTSQGKFTDDARAGGTLQRGRQTWQLMVKSTETYKH